MVLSAAGVVTYAIAEPSTKADGARETRKPAIHTLKLKDRGAGRKGLERRSTERFSAVVLTWNDPEAEAKGTPEVRTRDLDTGTWSPWRRVTLEPSQADGAEGERAALRGGTESVWTGDSDGIELRMVNADGTEAKGQPAGMDVKLLDPGTDPKGTLRPAAFSADETPDPATDTPTDAPTDTPTDPATTADPTDPAPTTEAPAPTDTPTDTPTGTASPSPTPTVPEPRPSTVAKPPIITQAEWGASTDYDGTPSYSETIKAAVIHHTGVDSDNAVSCADSRARLRTIQQSHFSQGYFDIGYNFVVDRCGQIFEGRSGGMDLPVIGAHDAGFNTDTVGISYIGNFESAKPSKAGLDAIARVVAWKFGMYGVDPTGKVALTSGVPQGASGNKYPLGASVTLPRVLGHRDTNTTACPGANLYPKLSRIAQLAATPGISHALPTSDTDRDGLADLVAGTPRAQSGGGTVTVVPGGVDGPVAAARRTFSQSSTGVPGSHESGDGFGTSTAWGDVNGDGHADLAIGAPGEDDTSGHADRGAVTVLYGPALNSGFSYTTSGSVTATGAKLGSTVAVGDFDGDGKADVFAAGTGKGGNWNARLTGGKTSTGTLTSATGAIAYLDSATGDFNRDGYADVALNYRDAGGIGRVVRFAGSATGLTKAGVLSVKGGRAVASGDVDGNGYDDLVIGQPYVAESGAATGGQVTMLFGTSAGFTTTGMKVIHQNTASVPGSNEAGDAFGGSVSVGDQNADGYADALVGLPGEDISRDGNRSNAGMSVLLKGTASGLTGAGSIAFSQDTSGVPGVSESGDTAGSSVSLTDFSGYGRADLVVGVEGEDAGNGIVMYVPSGSAGLGFGSTAILSRTPLGTPSGAHLGQTLTP
ncbi:FG-GAP-like repeat-containing protein [Streptomyces nigra]|uniref:FG-GAP-like repeat-containing protein n=1 Tax=Streptomyces nigra TaxID=1827580 RepID=UPI003697CE36